MKYSVIMPSFQAGKEIGRNLPGILRNIDKSINKDEIEIIVVLDGSTDDSFNELCLLEKRFPQLRHVGYLKNEGKGYAISYGLQYAHGMYVAYYDIDGSTKVESMIGLFKLSEEENSSIIGSRYLTRKNISQVMLRRVTGKAFNSLVRHDLGIPFKDTQCGCKVFTRPAVNFLLTQKWSSGYAFDAEIIVKLLNAGFALKEVPVKWNDEKRNFFINLISVIRMTPPMYKRVKRLKKEGIIAYD